MKSNTFVCGDLASNAGSSDVQIVALYGVILRARGGTQALLHVPSLT